MNILTKCNECGKKVTIYRFYDKEFKLEYLNDFEFTCPHCKVEHRVKENQTRKRNTNKNEE